MKPIILFFVLTLTLQAQYLTKEKLFFYGSTILSSTLSGVTEGAQQREQHTAGLSAAEKMKLNKQWHITQTGERVSWIVTGVSISLDSDFNFIKMLSDLSVTASIHWILYDGLENFYRDKPFFWVSDFQKTHNTSLSDKFASWQFKTGFLLITILINYLIY